MTSTQLLSSAAALLALSGYLAGIAVIWLEHVLIGL